MQRMNLMYTAGGMLVIAVTACTTTNINAGRHYTHAPVYTDGRTEAEFFSGLGNDVSQGTCRCAVSSDRRALPVPVSNQTAHGYFQTAVTREPDNATLNGSGSPMPDNKVLNNARQKGTFPDDDPEGFFSGNPPRAYAGKTSLNAAGASQSDQANPANTAGSSQSASVNPPKSGNQGNLLSVPVSPSQNQAAAPQSAAGTAPPAVTEPGGGSQWKENPASGDFNETGIASWYGRDFDGKITASGQPFDSRRPTAAHKTIPIGSIIAVKNLENNKEIMVVVNDRGPYVSGRILDVSEYAAELLDFKSKGLARVGIRLVKKGDGKTVSKEGVTASYFGADGKIADPVPYKIVDAESVPAVSLLNPLNINTPAVDPKQNRRNAAPEPVTVRIQKESDLRGYSVQVGIFENRDNAVQLKRYLDAYGVPVGVYKRDDKYVVKVGDFTTRFAADQMKFRLAADGYSGFVSEPD